MALRDWAAAALDYPGARLETVSGDASFRRYFRIRRSQETWIAVDAPPEHENNPAFVAIANTLVDAGLQAPKVLDRNLEQGFLLLADLGDRLYLPALNEDNADALYDGAIDALVRMQKIRHVEGFELPDYDEALLRREMQLFPDWFLSRHLQLELDDEGRQRLADTFNRLCQSALDQPRVFVHRDYHSRNLMLVEDGPGIIDFQDAVWGPITYDLVSLLRDCYIAWPDTRIEAWIARYQSRARAAGILPAMVAADFRRDFDLMGMQRHLKAIGIFARLNYRDGKDGYLKDIPRTFGYVREVAHRYPELAGFADWLERTLIPAMARKFPDADL